MYFYFRFMASVISMFSFTAIDVLSEIIGSIIYVSGNWRIRAIDGNLRAIGARNYSLRKIFVNMTKNHFELIKLYRMKPQKLKEITKLEGYKNIESLKNNSFIMTGHCGNWDAAPNYIYAEGIKSCTIAEYKNVNKEMYRVLDMFRGAHGMIIYPLEDAATPLKFRDRIKEGYTPFILIDRDITKTGISVKIRDKTLRIPKGPFFFAKKTSSRMVTGGFFRCDSRRYRFKIILNDLGVIDEIESGAQKAIDSLFEIIRNECEQWYAFDLNWEK
ncbi:MAG: hypothetical protein PHW02_06350 [bacterium]|nr:hypothetical protein [bacterium]